LHNSTYISFNTTFNVWQKANTINKTKKQNIEDLNATIQQYLKLVRLLLNDYLKQTIQPKSLEYEYWSKYIKKEIEANLNATI